VDWHPNNVLLACGSADGKARVLSAYIKDVDKRPAATIWGEKLPFNTVCGEYASPSGGWVHSVAFSPSGDVLAFVSHDSSITIAYPSGPAIFTVKTPTLPYVTLTWTSEDSIVAAGHDCQPVLFSTDASAGGWKYVGSLDDTSSGGSTASKLPSPATPRGAASGIGRLNNEAFNRFKMADSRGSSSGGQGGPVSPGGAGSASGESELLTVHQNTITTVRPYEVDQNGNVSRVSTAGVDGRLVIWNVAGVKVGGFR
jgi:actin related protein 2/3 complex subunit 1A/1B